MGKKTLEAEIFERALQQVNPNKVAAARTIAAVGRFPVTAVAEILGVARTGLAASARAAPHGRRSRPPMPADDLLARILDVIGELPTYGYRRVHTLLRQQAKWRAGRPEPQTRSSALLDLAPWRPSGLSCGSREQTEQSDTLHFETEVCRTAATHHVQ
jgi:hypothetical protein